ncbi:c-type cytochrome domain-containing protein [Fuerstiella marisgermanici]|uniref:c-type cytochrome domain-containing protein n=1 Tax=Fuerstiella marisgermanici TaxID=1891926 RepID=UPI001314DA90|nr:c-type cytochrome domain-containing protein [Fuerstiella marisgermanici]
MRTQNQSGYGTAQRSHWPGSQLRCWFAGIVLLVCTQATFADGDTDRASAFKKTVAPFLKTYCVKCHGAKKPKGDRRFDVLSGRIADNNDLIDLQDILDQLNLSEMPPPDEAQPSDDERRMVIAWLTGAIADYHTTQRRANQCCDD